MSAYAAPAPRQSLLARSWDLVRRHVLTVYAVLAFTYLLLPIAVVIAFSFNDPAGRFNYTWQGFTLDNWRNWDGVPGLVEAMTLSLQIAAISAIVATDPRDADRARARALRVPRPVDDELPDLPADVVAGDRARRVAADALSDAAVRDRVPDDPDRAHHVQHLVRRRHGEGAARRLRPAPRGSRDGPRRERVDDVPQGDAAADRARRSSPPRCCRSRCRSTTS